MSAQSEYTAAISMLQQLIQTNAAAVPDDKPEMFYKWIQSKCAYLQSEQQPFSVAQNQVPQTLSVDNYNYLANSIGIILGIVASFLKIVNGIVDLIKKMPRKAK